MRWRRAVAALVVLVLLVPAGTELASVRSSGAPTALAAASDPAAADDGAAAPPCAGTVRTPANGVTVISVQGQRFDGERPRKTPARLVAVGPRGGIRWVHESGDELGVVWSYDVDPLPNGTLFVTATRPGRTVFYELDARTGTVRWEQELPFVDTHDADLVDGRYILVAHMRNYNETAGRNDDRLLLYDRRTNETVWEWYFRDHYPREAGGPYDEDWTHVNDVDRIAPGRYLASPRNLDQVIVVERSSGEISLQLGADDRFQVLKRQHNPQYLESETGAPTVLVADSENDRIVEYERRDGGWERTWTLAGAFRWPRDADRLPDGNTLVVDSLHHRVVEVTPRGEVVWEVFAPWLVYDAERVALGDEAGGPTIADRGAAGDYRLAGGTVAPTDRLEACAAAIRAVGGGGTPSSEGTGEGRTVGTADTLTATPGQPGFGAGAAAIAMGLLAGSILATSSGRKET